MCFVHFFKSIKIIGGNKVQNIQLNQNKKGKNEQKRLNVMSKKVYTCTHKNRREHLNESD